MLALLYEILEFPRVGVQICTSDHVCQHHHQRKFLCFLHLSGLSKVVMQLCVCCPGSPDDITCGKVIMTLNKAELNRFLPPFPSSAVVIVFRPPSTSIVGSFIYPSASSLQTFTLSTQLFIPTSLCSPLSLLLLLPPSPPPSPPMTGRKSLTMIIISNFVTFS